MLVTLQEVIDLHHGQYYNHLGKQTCVTFFYIQCKMIVLPVAIYIESMHEEFEDTKRVIRIRH